MARSFARHIATYARRAVERQCSGSSTAAGTELIQITTPACPSDPGESVDPPVAFTPDSSRLVFEYNCGPTYTLASVGVDNTGFAPITSSSFGFGKPDVSPDGSAVVYESANTIARDRCRCPDALSLHARKFAIAFAVLRPAL